MEPITIAAFDFDDENVEKLAAHGVTSAQVEQVLEDNIVVRRNRKGRNAPFIVFGRDRSGQCLAIPVAPTDDPVIWRPVTAWYCKQSEAARLPRRR